MTVIPSGLEFPTLPQYWDLLDQHDWFWDFSEDQFYWHRGRAQNARLLKIAEKGGPEYQAMYDGFHAFHFFYGPKEQRPGKPARP